MPYTGHTEFTPFVLDSRRHGGETARGDCGRSLPSRRRQRGRQRLPLRRDRLRENEVVRAQFILVFSDYLYSPHAADCGAMVFSLDGRTVLATEPASSLTALGARHEIKRRSSSTGRQLDPL
jgi:hypothetical protein